MASGRDSFSGCGCFLAIIVVVGILGGIRSCVVSLINGDNPLPSFGSSKVSGGSGGYGTSNGYNVKYKNTTSPNYNSSQKDYSYTDQYPTEYKEGERRRKPTPQEKMGVHYQIMNEIEKERKEQKGEFKKCHMCKGTGVYIAEYVPMDRFITSCPTCGKKDHHFHAPEKCNMCNGTGKIYE